MIFAPIDNEIVENSEAAYLVDYQGEGEMLAVCFGFYDAGGDNKFDFYKRLKKLEGFSGKKINKLLLRDKNYDWYHYGVPPLGRDVDETVAAIKGIIAEIKPSQVVAIGQSMGGYAAILYGALLEVEKVISFGTLSCFDARKLELLRDQRWLEVVKKVQAAPPKVFYNDLPELLKRRRGKAEIEIFYGTNPGKGADPGEAVNFDAAHAIQFYGIGGVKLFPVHRSPHAIVEYFRVNKVINNLLLNRLFGLRPAVRRDIGVRVEWVKWLEENIAFGCSDEQLMTSLVKSNFTPEVAASALAAVHAEYELQKIIS